MTCEWCGSKTDCDCDPEIERAKRAQARRASLAPTSAFRADIPVCPLCEFPLILHGWECER